MNLTFIKAMIVQQIKRLAPDCNVFVFNVARKKVICYLKANDKMIQMKEIENDLDVSLLETMYDLKPIDKIIFRTETNDIGLYSGDKFKQI